MSVLRGGRTPRVQVGFTSVPVILFPAALPSIVAPEPVALNLPSELIVPRNVMLLPVSNTVKFEQSALPENLHREPSEAPQEAGPEDRVKVMS